MTQVEDAIRPFTVGRKNFLFSDSVRGAQASAIIYSIVETAKANNLNVLRYLETLLRRLPGYTNESEGMDVLLPWSQEMYETGIMWWDKSII